MYVATFAACLNAHMKFLFNTYENGLKISQSWIER